MLVRCVDPTGRAMKKNANKWRGGCLQELLGSVFCPLRLSGCSLDHHTTNEALLEHCEACMLLCMIVALSGDKSLLEAAAL